MSLSSRLKDFLAGYMSAAPDGNLNDFEKIDWKEFAVREREKRATRLIEILDDELIDAIAEGQLSITQCVKELKSEGK